MSRSPSRTSTKVTAGRTGNPTAVSRLKSEGLVESRQGSEATLSWVPKRGAVGPLGDLGQYEFIEAALDGLKASREEEGRARLEQFALVAAGAAQHQRIGRQEVRVRHEVGLGERARVAVKPPRPQERARLGLPELEPEALLDLLEAFDERKRRLPVGADEQQSGAGCGADGLRERSGTPAITIDLSLLGEFNVDNLLAVAGTLHALGEAPAEEADAQAKERRSRRKDQPDPDPAA